MQTMTKSVRDFGFEVECYRQLVKISKALHTLAENECNYGLSVRQQTRGANLLKKAQEIADRIGYKVYHQGDPRGCSLYLLDGSEGDDYTQGVAVY